MVCMVLILNEYILTSEMQLTHPYKTIALFHSSLPDWQRFRKQAKSRARVIEMQEERGESFVIDKIFGLEAAQKCQVVSLFCGLSSQRAEFAVCALLCELAFGLCCHHL